MVSILFRKAGVEYNTYLGRGQTITSHSYIEDFLKPLVGCIDKQRSTFGSKNLKFHKDNAKPHTTQIVTTFLKAQNYPIMDHSPY